MKRFRNGSKKGFTLVETMSVVAVIGMITAMSVPHFLRMRVSSNEAATQTSLASLYTLVEDYRFANGSYPETGDAKSLFTNFVGSYYGKQSVISNLDSGGNYWSFQGYRYDYQLFPGGWEYAAMPDKPGITGNRYFAIDSSGTVREIAASYAETFYALAAPGDAMGHAVGIPTTPIPKAPPPKKKPM